MPSNVEKRVRPAGGSRTSKTPWGLQQVVSESKSEARHQRQLRSFYRRRLPHRTKAHRIMIMGPGEAKTGLMKVIADNPALSARVAGVETRDKMTPKQVAARVGAFFEL